jgi:type 1 glutamine amidotransferase
MTRLVLPLLLLTVAGRAAAEPPKTPTGGKKLKVCLVSGSVEYQSDESLASFQEFLEKNHPVECVRAFRKTDTDVPGLDALETCDAAVFYTRRLPLTGEQLDRVKKYTASGRPVVGVRTASHGFQTWLEMDKLVFGGDYKNHHKHGIQAEVSPVKGADHPVLTGVGSFTTTGGLYKNPSVAADVTVLMTGTAGPVTEPVAWVRERKLDGGAAQRVFYTSLGTPEDFKNPAFVRLLTNGLLWAADRPVPTGR